MKKVFAAVILCLCILPVACKKKSKTNIGYSVQPPKGLDTLVGMGAKVNGTAWHTDSVYAYISKSIIDSTKVNLQITATQKLTSPLSTITFTITNYSGPKTYTVDPPYVSATYYLGNYRHYATTGQIIVGSDDPYGITGTFNFTADSTVINEGTFNAAQP